MGAKSVVRAWVAKANRVIVDDDPFTSDDEWRWHQWCEANPEIVENVAEFSRMMAESLPSVEDCAQAFHEFESALRGDTNGQED